MDSSVEVIIVQTLGEEEDAWYRQDGSAETVAAIKAWIRERHPTCIPSGNPIEDDEDVWVRR